MKSYGQIFYERYTHETTIVEPERPKDDSFVEYAKVYPHRQRASEDAAQEVIATFLERQAREQIHLMSTGDYGTACGRPGQTLSRHELKRFRINCSDCIDAARKEEEARRERMQD